MNKRKQHSPATTSKKSPQATAVKRMLSKQHTVLLAREHHNRKRTFHSFLSFQTAHHWMQTLSNATRSLYQFDLSAWLNETLSEAENNHIQGCFVSPLVFDVEWLSTDGLPDPLAMKRLALLQEAVIRHWKAYHP